MTVARPSRVRAWDGAGAGVDQPGMGTERAPAATQKAGGAIQGDGMPPTGKSKDDGNGIRMTDDSLRVRQLTHYQFSWTAAEGGGPGIWTLQRLHPGDARG